MYKKTAIYKKDMEYNQFPLSIGQKSLWHISQFQSGNSAYNLIMAIKIKGILDNTLVERSLHILLDRHEMLRAVIKEISGVPYQYIIDNLEMGIQYRDLKDKKTTEQDKIIHEYMYEESVFVYDLEQGPLLRVSLLETQLDEQIFIFNFHHIIADGWSIQLFMKEFIEVYYSLEKGKEHTLPKIEFCYRDYVKWQYDCLNKGLYEKDIQYWSSKLKNVNTTNILPLDFSKASRRNYRGKNVSYEIDEETTKCIQELSKVEKSTPFAVLLTCFKILLYRYSNQSDILVGIPVAGRNRYEVESIIGLFVNTLVIRSKVNGNLTFRELLKKVTLNTIEAYEHQDIPFAQLVEDIKPDTIAEEMPFFETFFSFQTKKLNIKEFHGLSYELMHMKKVTSKFDLSFEIEAYNNRLIVNIEYRDDLFKQERIHGMFRHYRNIIHHVINAPESKITDINMLSEEEKSIIITKWNNTNKIYSDKDVIQLFEEQVRLNPNKIAVRYGDETISYKRLSLLSNQVASYLLDSQVISGDRIVLCMESGIGRIASILGIWKVGGCYIPCDPLWPAKRIAKILEDVNAKLLIKDESIAYWNNGVTNTVDIEDIKEIPICNPIQRQLNLVDTAYILFTSGSTGKPKGVMISHQSLINLLNSMIECPGIEVTDRFLSVTNYTFDISILEMFLPLIVGAEVNILSRLERLEGSKLRNRLEQYRPTIMQGTPATWQMIIDAGWQGDGKLKILCGGEKLTKNLAKDLLSKGQLWNMYGPTETTIWSLIHEVTEEEEIPIGRPIANTYVYILDKHLNPVPVGVPGDIYIGGLGLAQGYYCLPKKNQDKFLHNQWRTGKIYATGDRGKYNCDGYIYYLGREDDQLKIRGYRIEAQEIEERIKKCDGVKDALVTKYRDDDKIEKLIAYVVINKSLVSLTSHSIYTHLSSELPYYMLPSKIQLMEKFPLTAHGKVDRKQLPIFSSEPLEAYDIDIKVNNHIEEQMVKVWKEVLHQDKINLTSHFFLMGGHSLLATQLLNKIESVFKVSMKLSDIIHYPKLVDMCKRLNTYLEDKNIHYEKTENQGFPSITPDKANRERAFQLTEIQKAYWLGRKSSIGLGNIATHIYYEIEMSQLDIEKFNQAVNQLINRHDMLRAIIQPDGTQRIWDKVPDYVIEVTNLDDMSLQEQNQYLEDVRYELSHKVLQEDKWPLFHIRASKYDGITRVHIGVDLLIADAWSLQILSNELMLYYYNQQENLPSIEVSYRDYVIGLYRYYESSIYANHKKYWMDRVQHLPSGPKFPFLIEPDTVKKPTFKRIEGRIKKFHWSRLKKVANSYNITPNALLLTAFTQVIKKWTKESHFTLNLTYFNRLPIHKDIYNVVGDFTSLIVLEIRNKGNSLIECARELQKQLWEDMDHSLFCGTKVMNEMIKKGYIDNVLPIVFTSMLGFEHDHYNETKDHNSSKQIFGISQTPQIWLDHQVIEHNGELIYNWDYVADIFPSELIEMMFSSYTMLIQQLVNEDIWIAQSISIVKDKMDQLLIENYTQDVLSEDLLYSAFIRQAQYNPDRIAIVAHGKELTYGELHNMSNCVAAKLREYNLEQTVIGIYMEKGWEQIVAIIGILKAGYVYLPIEANTPIERIKYMLDKVHSTTVIVQEQTQDRLTLPDIQKLRIEEKNYNIKTYNAIEQSPEDTAYIIFTSGSTGEPKGVVISHRSAVNTIYDINKRFKVTREDRILGVSSYAFDLSVYDIFGIISVGGVLVIPNAQQIYSPEHWASLIRDYGITLWNSVPALFNMLFNTKDLVDELVTLRLVLLSGDWVPISLVKQSKKINEQVKVVSLGGATEASIWSIYYEIEEINPLWGSIPYGWSLTNQRVYVLDDQLQICPIWKTGKIYIGGIGLAKGYVNDEIRTSERFIIHPNTHERIYDTGDLGRYISDGSIEFQGREDNQVKVQGFRIELEEIENTIKKHPMVKNIVVKAEGEVFEDKKLVAYVVPEYGNETSNEVMITDKGERLDFKLQEKAIRKDLDNTCIDIADLAYQPEQNIYMRRRSYRKFESDIINYKDFCHLLNHLSQITLENLTFPKYLYGSSGGLYPVQVYLYIKDKTIENIPMGYYYYNPQRKSLVLLSREIMDSSIYVTKNQSIYNNSAFSIFLVAQMEAIEPMYGREHGGRFCLMEAGAISQLLEMIGPDYNIGLCQIGVFDFEAISHNFQLNENTQYLHHLLGGKISNQLTTKEGLLNEFQQYTAYNNRNKINDYINEIREMLIKKLPFYMIPTSFIIMDELPLTPNGKIDRVALGKTCENNKTRPRVPLNNELTPVGNTIINIWKEIFHLEDIHPYDNFFDLGGDSLLIVQVHSQLEERLGMNIKVVDLFRYPTVDSLAGYLEGNKTNNHKVSMDRAQLRLSKRRKRR
ncbi:non-ribosomal peptide synthetase [Vallitalea guaymasensis]|uniref:non-ribosomal peptide synthetase n=1 Tax=Vallitalea guaymasensis TaxID=1185412 RepID=UPI000DE3D718|nr:non-ribosomal peptide synthetase [Vallitalea guaymasensis]